MIYVDTSACGVSVARGGSAGGGQNANEQGAESTTASKEDASRITRSATATAILYR